MKKIKTILPKKDVFDSGWYPPINFDASNHFKLPNYLSKLFSGFLDDFGDDETTYGKRKDTA